MKEDWRDVNMSKRHAYLLMAHNNFEQLCRLLRQLDDERNDIYLHIDRKSGTQDIHLFLDSVKKSNLYIIENPIPVYWGDFSQIECEMLLLKRATQKEHYFYYHLLSGACMAIKSQDYIHSFFEENEGKEFISMHSSQFAEKVKFRFKYYYPYPCMRVLNKYRSQWTKGLIAVCALTQKLIGIDRSRKNKEVRFGFGAQWFSISDEFARFVLSKEKWITDTFMNTYCCDEVFMQTVVANSPFAEKLYLNSRADGCMRLIDWTRGHPYTYKGSDLKEIIDSPMLFVRKIDYHSAPNLVEEILAMTIVK